MMINKEIDKLIKKTDYIFEEHILEDDIKEPFIYILYNKESKNIIKIKKLIKMSEKYQWWYHDDFSPHTKYTIVINEKPLPQGTTS
jgi:hypothetical protein